MRETADPGLGAGAAVLAVLACTGCLGVFASDGGSLSFGTHSKGALLHPSALPFAGAGYEVHPDWRSRNRRYATAQVARWLIQVFAQTRAKVPGGIAYLGDISGRSGGETTKHRSHASGRDIDIFYMACDSQGRPMRGLPAMLHFGTDGSASRWSPGQSRRARGEALPDAYFDAPRNWALVRAMLENSEVEVQWIFVHRGIAALLLAEAAREGAPPWLVERARALLHQPTDSQPHDDHMHVRVFCNPGDRLFGCSDKGPQRWLKKHWKYMQPGDAVAMAEARGGP